MFALGALAEAPPAAMVTIDMESESSPGVARVARQVVAHDLDRRALMSGLTRLAGSAAEEATLVARADFDPQADQAIEYDFIGRVIAGRYTVQAYAG